MTKRLLVALALFADSAAAEPEQAKAHFKQGKAYQDAGAHAKAAEEYKAAYELDPRPEMLFNIAQAYRLSGQRQLAIDYFKKYVDAQPGGVGADEARDHIATLTKQLEDEKPAPKQPEPIVVRGSRTLRIAGLATGGAGVIAAGLGIKWGFDARNAAATISQHQSGMWTDDDERLFKSGQVANRNMIIAYIASGVLVGTGAVLYWRGSRATLVPAATTTSASIAVTGEF